VGPAGAHPAGDGPVIGVLGLQGDVLEHVTMLRAAGAKAVLVKRADEIDQVDGLVIPGGESTTIGKLADMYGLLEPLRKAIDGGLPVLGTCAGAILLSQRALFADGAPSEQPLLGVLQTTARRNAFGRQVASFEVDLEVDGIAGGPLHAVFIRAPWFEEIGPEVTVLATVDSPDGPRAVVVRQGEVIAAAFHPELSGDGRLHGAFVEMVGASVATR
jgi:5'-phosphate synthase pdxT subunit